MGESPAEVRKNVGRRWKWLEVVRRLVKARKGCGTPNMASGSKPTSVGRAWKSAEDGGSQIGSVERVGRVLDEARASAEEEARLGRGKASCGKTNHRCGKLQKWNGSASNLPEVVGRLWEGIGVHRRVWEGTGVRH